ncbi:MAG: hypothetical protein IJF12_02380 [Alphaproteobacteria bacterium]|nr:hypothetical protein [Alphaproteobacteria bacterium]
MTDNEIIKEIQGIKESMKRHIDLTNEMGQDLLRIDEEYTGGSKVWLTTDYFKKVVKHFCHSNYLVKCLELVFCYINRLQAENERLNFVRTRDAQRYKEKISDQAHTNCTLIDLHSNAIKEVKELEGKLKTANAEIEELNQKYYWKHKEYMNYRKKHSLLKAEAYKEFAERLKEKYSNRESGQWNFEKAFIKNIDNLLKELVSKNE